MINESNSVLFIIIVNVLQFKLMTLPPRSLSLNVYLRIICFDDLILINYSGFNYHNYANNKHNHSVIIPNRIKNAIFAIKLSWHRLWIINFKRVSYLNKKKNILIKFLTPFPISHLNSVFLIARAAFSRWQYWRRCNSNMCGI